MLKDKRKTLIEYIRKHADFLKTNSETLNIYEGNLKPYVDAILKKSLSTSYWNAIEDRYPLVNILPKYIDKVSTTYSKPPVRKCLNPQGQAFVDEYAKILHVNRSGMTADVYANLHKGFAWEPYVNLKGEPALRELSFDKFLVYSDSSVNPDEETVFLKFMGQKGDDPDTLLIFAYTDEEFDAFYLGGKEATEYLIDNQGINPVGVIPFVYGKRQKNKLIPTLDTDILSIVKSIPSMLADAAGAQTFQAFSILYGIDVNAENLTMTPNAFWSLKSDRESDKTPQIGSVKPEADTDKVMSFIMNVFVLWLETKGVRVGSVGSMDATNLASGISKIIDEMDAWELKKKNQAWFKQDEEELWNVKMPKIHEYWIKSGQIDPKVVPAMVQNPECEVVFEAPKPLISRAQEIADIKAELEIKTMTLEQAIKRLNPEYTDEQILEVMNAEILSEDKSSPADQEDGEDEDSGSDT